MGFAAGPADRAGGNCQRFFLRLTVSFAFAGEGSVAPPARARTANVYLPLRSPEYRRGLSHAPNSASCCSIALRSPLRFSLHSNVAIGLLAEKLNLASAPFLPALAFFVAPSI